MAFHRKNNKSHGEKSLRAVVLHDIKIEMAAVGEIRAVIVNFDFSY